MSPWKLVKMTGKDQSMTLTKVITDAKTHITGTPVSMEDMMKAWDSSIHSSCSA